MNIYVVKEGDSLDSIATETGSNAEAIGWLNQVFYPYRLAIGQALLIPEGTMRDLSGISSGNLTDTSDRQTVNVNGYAYPFIREWVLSETLPFLTTLSVFSYGFNTDGELIPPQTDDSRMISLAWQQGVRPILTLTPFDESGMFNNYLIHVIVTDLEAQQQLIVNLLASMSEKGFAGVDIDFEYILPEDREAFASFVSNVQTQLSPLGYPVSVALAPKISSTQTGLLYEGKDYGLLGAAADSVLLMTYEWGYTYGPPLPVAPIQNVRQVVDYALTEIPASKIDLGIPNYGYDWTLPFVRGVTAARTIGNIEAVDIAIENNAVIQFDETAKSPFFTYERNGAAHEVWFEDVRSIQAKFNLIKEYNLRGMGYWQIMKLFRANWYLLLDNFAVR